MTLAAWGGLAIAWLAGIVTPGPDVLVVLRLGVRERRAAVFAALGVMGARGGIAQLHAARSGSPDVAGSRVRRPFLLGVTTNLGRATPWIDIVAGTLFVLIAAVIATGAINTLL